MMAPILCAIWAFQALQQPHVVDDFEDVSTWQAAPASGVEMHLAAAAGHDGKAMQVGFDFHGGGGWAAFHKDLSLHLPENYEISFWLKGDAPRNTLEFKLIDPSGENVWWVNRPDFEYRGDWRKITFRKRHVVFAWGPKGGGDIREVGAIEFAITAGTGGKGTVWIDDLTLSAREPVLPYTATPHITNAGNSHVLDFTRNREFGGIIIDWPAATAARDFDVQISSDGTAWQTVRSVRGGTRARDYLQLPESESRYLRITTLQGAAAADIRDVRVLPIEWGASSNALFETIAADAPRGSYPKYFIRRQSYWTVVGAPAAEREALINEEGAVEVGKRGFSIEPFLSVGGRLITWADARITQALLQNHLPIPTVTWSMAKVNLRTTVWLDSASHLHLRYRVENPTREQRHIELYLALRPFQVDPSTQFLNTQGGFTPISSLSCQAQWTTVDAYVVTALPLPSDCRVADYDHGDVIDYLRAGTLPAARTVRSGTTASGVLAYRFDMPPQSAREVYLAVDTAAEDASAGAQSLARTGDRWRRRLDGVEIDTPDSRINASVRANHAYILINADGPAIQPGSRAYERSWIRDGSLTSAALLRLGDFETVRRFIGWFAPFQYADGKVPCCVDRRGADPVPENDSHGELIYAISEYFRFTRDSAFTRTMYPHVVRAIAYIDSLRNSRRTPAYKNTAFWGLEPQSISHEGYSAKPMHSYWDDFFALTGLKHATMLAHALGDSAHERAWAHDRDEFQSDLAASLQLAMQQHKIDYLPGAAELGDFDATSTTVALNPAGAENVVPAAALHRTFDKYWENFVARRDSNTWDAYTPYEWRVAGAFVRLGQPERAQALLEWFMPHQRPAGWHEWAEVVYRDRNAPHFIGDMPHTWVGSDFIRSVLDMFVYDEADSLIVGAGIVPGWLDHGSSVSIRGVYTPYGAIAYELHLSKQSIVIDFGERPRPPARGFVIHSPLNQPLRSALADGGTIPVRAHEVWLATLPRRLVLSY